MAAARAHSPFVSQTSFSTFESVATTTPGAALDVTIFQGRDLAAKDSNGLSDPYLKIFLLNKKGKAPSSFSKKAFKRSKIVKESLNPTFVDAHFEWMPDQINEASALVIQVWDWDKWTADDFMGEVVFPLDAGAFSHDTTWYEVQSRHGKRDRVSGSLLLGIRFDIAGLSAGVPQPTVLVSHAISQLTQQLESANLSPELRSEYDCTIQHLHQAQESHRKTGGNPDELRVAIQSQDHDVLDSDDVVDEDDPSIPDDLMQDCPICFDSFQRKKLRDYGCGHLYCVGCLAEDLKVNIGSGGVKDLKCPDPNCAVKPSPLHIRLYAGREWHVRAQEFLALQNLRENPNARWCPRPTCSTPVVVNPNDLPEDNEVECTACHEKFCFICRHAGHAPESCGTVAEADDEVALKLYLGRQPTTKPCPRCQEGVEKNGGCNHMTCINCQHQWCWLCLQHCPDPAAHYHAGPCNGHWFTTANNLQEANAVGAARQEYRRRHPIASGLKSVAGGVAAGAIILVAGVVVVGVCVIVIPIALVGGLLGAIFS